MSETTQRCHGSTAVGLACAKLVPRMNAVLNVSCMSPCIGHRGASACRRSSQSYLASVQHTPCVCSTVQLTPPVLLRGPSSVAALVAELGAQATALQQQPEVPPGGEVNPSDLPQGEPSLPRFPSGIPQVLLQELAQPALIPAAGNTCHVHQAGPCCLAGAQRLSQG